jgi:hypothetical protein
MCWIIAAQGWVCCFGTQFENTLHEPDKAHKSSTNKSI